MNSYGMETLLTPTQASRYNEFKEFVGVEVEPFAQEWDTAQQLPRSVISLLAKLGYLAVTLPSTYGGTDCDFVTFGLLNEALGRGSSALANLVTVQTMVSTILLKWGTAQQREVWIHLLACGQAIGAFALTEPTGGSDTRALQTSFCNRNGNLYLKGEKRWISFGHVADIFLVFGKLENDFVACLVPREAPGLEVEPVRGMLGFRAAGLATLKFHDVEVPVENIVGKPGFGLSYVASVGLHYGRMSTACSAAGLLRACFEESRSYVTSRKINGRMMGEIGMVRSLIARMGTDLEAAQLLCHAACRAEDEHATERFARVMTAKYFNSKAAVRAASDAVQLHGAAGCHESAPVARYYRDAKLMEILEGTTQIHEHLLAEVFINELGR